MPPTRTRKIPPDFRKNVFINCPFDDDYLWLFRAIAFTTHVLGFNLRCALEESNAGNTRIDKIQNRRFISDISGPGVYAHGGTQRPRF